ncbi:glycosyl hydrolase family 28 protein [Planosporangium sp. 12N6]|uniref:glycosyl hydrolase family 28 protein n=1 Tax=Planosporangium spinosum TaxID=3402278 RepID=UPI003CEF1541
MFGTALRRGARSALASLAILLAVGTAPAAASAPAGVAPAGIKPAWNESTPAQSTPTQSTPAQSTSAHPTVADPVGGRRVFDVRSFGATGGATTNDSPAVDAAIAAANAAGGGIVRFPPGTYLAGSSIHLMSNVTLLLDAGATLLGAPTGYDPPEPNPNDRYQDFGHSHFHNAMIWGDNLRNVGFLGSGVIDGGGNFITGNPKPGQADKLISLTRCDGLVVGGGLTLRRGGHFAMLINGCDHVFSDRLTIDTASDRDGWNIISTRNVLITNITIASNDDALAFKSDWALGATLPNGNVVVANAHLSARCCNALMFGSETCGDFSHYRFSHITITGAGKSGLGMVSMDGARISDVHYDDVTMSGTASPITQKVETRRRCGTDPGTGSISDVHYTNVRGTDAGSFSPTLWGQPGHEIRDVTFHDVHLTLPGGHAAMDPNVVPSDNGDYNPSSLSTRPAYGFYLHNVAGVRFDDSSFDLAAVDARPAVIVNAGRDVTLRRVTARRGAGSPFDVGFQSVAGYCLTNGRDAALRLSTPDSTPGCRMTVDNFSLRVEPATRTGVAGGAVAYTVRTAATSGRPAPVTLAATGLPPGATARFDPPTVRPGGYSTLTVTTLPDTRNGPYTVTVVGADPTATQYARAGLSITGGVDLVVTDLVVSDPDNAADWSVQSDLQPGVSLYGDRTTTVASVPADLLGARWIRTADDSRTATADPLAAFTITAPATVVVAVDTRLGRPAWVDATWTDSGTQLTDYEGDTTYRRFQLFSKPFAAGRVALGPLAVGTRAGNMYPVIML